MLARSLLFCLILSLISCRQSESVEDDGMADTVLRNAHIYTVNEAQPTAEAIAIKADTIMFVGSEADAEALIGPLTDVKDMEGLTIVPGFIESHAHFLGIGKLKSEIDFAGTTSYNEIITLVYDAVQEAEPGEWITGRGWHQSKWDNLPEMMVQGFPTHHLLSAISPDNPVYIRHASGHAALANAKAMEIAGITAETTFDETGEVIKGLDGEPTGLMNEEAESLVTQHMPLPESELEVWAAAAAKECLANGITTVHDAGVGTESLDLFERLLEDENLPVRLYVMLNGKDQEQLDDWYERGPLLDKYLTVRSIKCYADGALGSYGALLLKPYTDAPHELGNPDQPFPVITAISKDALEYGFQVCTHAIGDRANQEVLNSYQTAMEAKPNKAEDHRFRVEHAQHLDLGDIPRFAELGVIASMQGIHMSSDRPWAINRLGMQRIVDGAYVWQKLLESGAKVINGTDAPVEPVSALACFYASISRKTLKGTPVGGYEADQRMSRAQALRSYTLDAAYGGFQENEKGSIEVGKLADLTVLSQDIMEVPAEDILNTQIKYTIVGGQIRYQQ
ncbi:MAG: amidohydrolase [Bacteroidota bacterium]